MHACSTEDVRTNQHTNQDIPTVFAFFVAFLNRHVTTPPCMHVHVYDALL